MPIPHLAVSLGFFCIGVFIPAQISGRLDTKSCRWWLLLTNLIQTFMVWLAALLNHLYNASVVRNNVKDTGPTLCSIGLLALASGAQVSMSRQLNLPEIPTTQATAAYVDLFVDPAFFGSLTVNRARNRRAAFLLILVAGSFVGAPAYKYVSSAFAIFLAGLVKLLVTIGFCLNRTARQPDKVPGV